MRAQFRHGDVLIEKLDAFPSGCRKLSHGILAHGEVTGHSHRLADWESADLYEGDSEFVLDVHDSGASIVHEEHATIELPPGLYRVWRQREYSPTEIRVVRD